MSDQTLSRADEWVLVCPQLTRGFPPVPKTPWKLWNTSGEPIRMWGGETGGHENFFFHMSIRIKWVLALECCMCTANTPSLFPRFVSIYVSCFDTSTIKEAYPVTFADLCAGTCRCVQRTICSTQTGWVHTDRAGELWWISSLSVMSSTHIWIRSKFWEENKALWAALIS